MIKKVIAILFAFCLFIYGQEQNSTINKSNAENKNQIFFAHRWQGSYSTEHRFFSYFGSGMEFEFGVIKKDKYLLTGIGGYSRDLKFGGEIPPAGYLSGGGGGVFAAPVISFFTPAMPDVEFFKFVPGIELGYWRYEATQGLEKITENLFGGPDIRIMLGYRFIFLDLHAKLYLGYGNDKYNDYQSDNEFKARFLWGGGLSFIINKKK
ncbi:MAG: hypothetical protein FWF51_06610 [Chitinivibrionia bacterium]|nr:hypothetical protein [Chitinivibrionia bacterium]